MDRKQELEETIVDLKYLLNDHEAMSYLTGEEILHWEGELTNAENELSELQLKGEEIKCASIQ